MAMRDGLVPSLALKLPETITYYACLSFFTGELWGKRRELTARLSPVRTWYCLIHAIFSTAFIEKRGARHWPGRSHRSPAAAGQSQCGVVVERATQLHGPCVRCGHRVHSGRAQLDCSSGWVAGGHRPKDNTSYTRRKVPLTEAGVERREPAQWDELPELRVWDPGDG